MGLGSHGICVPGHEFLDLGPGLGLILLGRLGLGQISLGQSQDKNLWDSQILRVEVITHLDFLN